ncbi:MAG: carboxypeptidase regulatory-like domain-containing protein, partial [Acidobacteriaceae bacterium]|nr:carboxypeptidase regulatory-like domain-containing protein [Acidobacteriaceae bacterium]
MPGFAKPASTLAISLLTLLMALPSHAAFQASGNGGTLQGIVTDPSGASIAGAEVTLTHAVSGYAQSVKTGTDGSFRLVNIPPDQYRLNVTAPGFQRFAQTVTVRTQVPIQINAQLALAGEQQTVEVSASAEVVENEPAAHTDVSQNLLANLPIASTGQGLSDAITLTSGGVVADSNGFFHPQGDHAETTYVVDGQPITDQQNKTFSTQLPANAFQSLELVSSSPNAEFGDKTGLIVNAVTRSGLGQKPSASFD